MKVGIVGPIWISIPPKAYGGTEDVVHNLVNGLSKKGHEVTLFGPANSKVKARLYPTVDTPLLENKINIEWTNTGYTLYHLAQAFERASEFDILHVHLNKTQDYIALALAEYSKTPVLFTLHFNLPSEGDNGKTDRFLLLKKYAHLPFTSISNSQQKPIRLNYIKTVYNGVNPELFPFSERPGTYLAWLGKVNPLKGTKEAILAAKKADLKIYIMGTIDRNVPTMLSYYEQEVRPLIDGRRAVWLGEVSHNEKTSILSGALAFLNPIAWEEPFGLVMAESQACGTPVISFRRGSAPELIADKKTGFLVDSLEEMVEKIRESEYIDRILCRKRVEERFTIGKMVEGYEEAYLKTIENWKKYRNGKRKYRSNEPLVHSM